MLIDKITFEKGKCLGNARRRKQENRKRRQCKKRRLMKSVHNSRMTHTNQEKRLHSQSTPILGALWLIYVLKIMIADIRKPRSKSVHNMFSAFEISSNVEGVKHAVERWAKKTQPTCLTFSKGRVFKIQNLQKIVISKEQHVNIKCSHRNNPR